MFIACTEQRDEWILVSDQQNVIVMSALTDWVCTIYNVAVKNDHLKSTTCRGIKKLVFI